ncbi:MAG TPA: hypothetical protein VMH33_01510 [Solirubrobacterales bacterium]|nr:hypothetical protein [Solirubrobacterales bacterium]
MSPHRPPTTLSILGLAALAAIAVALLVVASGGSDGREGPAAAARADNVVDDGGSIEIATASFPTGRDTDEVSATGAKPIRPCWLVPKRKAEAILGAGVTVTERPQGPTCVYSGSGREIDLVIEKVPLKALRNAARSAEAVTIAGRRGWCLRYQASSVVIAVGTRRVLQVTGACQAGVRFAAVAVPRIRNYR